MTGAIVTVKRQTFSGQIALTIGGSGQLMALASASYCPTGSVRCA